MTTPKPLRWIASSKRDLLTFPDDVQQAMGYAIHIAQMGGLHDDAKPLKGFGGTGVVEIVEDHQGDTFRTVYTVKFEEAVYVLHAFQKKSKQGRKTPQSDIELVRSRLKAAEDHHRQNQAPRGRA